MLNGNHRWQRPEVSKGGTATAAVAFCRACASAIEGDDRDLIHALAEFVAIWCERREHECARRVLHVRKGQSGTPTEKTHARSSYYFTRTRPTHGCVWEKWQKEVPQPVVARRHVEL